MNNKIHIYLVNVLIGEKGGGYSIDNMIGYSIDNMMGYSIDNMIADGSKNNLAMGQRRFLYFIDLDLSFKYMKRKVILLAIHV